VHANKVLLRGAADTPTINTASLLRTLQKRVMTASGIDNVLFLADLVATVDLVDKRA